MLTAMINVVAVVAVVVAVVAVVVAVLLVAFVLLSVFRTSLQTYCNNAVSPGAISFD